MEILLLRFDAPLMSFGDVIVDHHNVTDRFPRLSLLTGLFGNALGYRHGDAAALERLQERIEFAACWDVEPTALVDYHTVDLGQLKMANKGWTTRGVAEHREGGPGAKLGTHIRYRHYWANGLMTVTVTLTGGAEPSVAALAAALREPARPLFLGRKTCLPAAPLLREVVDAPNVLAALQAMPRETGLRPDASRSASACWPAHLGTALPSRVVSIYDQRDWRNQVHTGRRLRREGILPNAEAL
ncbi:MAG: type I-E CRISPR-associated protein Cas5/CasD [Candidatus Competibacteraceae bacterium]|nr:type I-E CRISPR-associated protein Cas5/CasD [Candidatus Competibacteraceae bacterium]MCP5125399.1 type I-E CRISPR-associated protein Cas5/CasD [Gammaproteobacteria bacterium]HRX71535.1 type I-E CRISPR-associated protein Cas5/CasD [Candidatus Competibacteraceae bacterium]